MASFSYKVEAGPCRPSVRYPTRGRRCPRGAAPGGPTTSRAPFGTALPARSTSLGSLGTSYLLTPCSTLSPAPGGPTTSEASSVTGLPARSTPDLWGVPPGDDPQASHRDYVGVIEPQRIDGGPTGRCETDDPGTSIVPPEVLGPVLLAEREGSPRTSGGLREQALAAPHGEKRQGPGLA